MRTRSGRAISKYGYYQDGNGMKRNTRHDCRRLPAINESFGFGLIEMLVVSAIGVVVALGFATVVSDLHKSANGVKFRTDADTFNEEIRALLSSKSACQQTFQSIHAHPSMNEPISSLKNGAGGEIYGLNHV